MRLSLSTRASIPTDPSSTPQPGGKPKVLKYEGFVPLFVNEPYRDLLSGDVPSEEGPGKAKEEGKGPAPFRPSHPMKARPGTDAAITAAVNLSWVTGYHVAGTWPMVGVFRPQKSVGLGDYYGTLGGMMAHIDDPGPNRKLKKGDVKHMLPNIRTSPHQRGTYGFIGLTLGEKMGRKGKGYTGEYAYEVRGGRNACCWPQACMWLRGTRATPAPVTAPCTSHAHLLAV